MGRKALLHANLKIKYMPCDLVKSEKKWINIEKKTIVDS